MNSPILCGLVLVAAAFVGAQDFQEYYPSARQLNLRRLANRLDRFIQVPRGFWDGSFLRQQSAMASRNMEDPGYENAPSDMIGVRGNFDDITHPAAAPSSEVAPRRMPLPMAIMEDTNVGQTLAPTQWQMMVSPFIMLMPDVGEFCHCRGMANCGCCIGFLLKPFGLRNNLCLNMTLTKDSYSQSQYMVHARLHYDTYKLLDFSVSEKQPPMACVSVVPFSTVAGCMSLVDIYRDREEEKMCTCLGASLQYKDMPVISIPTGCMCVGKPVPQNKKRGLFGLDFGALFGGVQNMLFG